MPTDRAPKSRSNGLGRVVLYYVALAVLAVLGLRFLPWMEGVIAGANLAGATLDPAVLGFDQPAVGSAVPGGVWSQSVVAGLSMLGAVAIMVPVTWVYMITHRRRGYDESVVHTMLILPVAVTGIVMIVQYNLAIAFSLAGIVAAVRFRTTLDDTKDAVYVFLGIGVGVASGVQALGIAVTLSVFFNGVVLALWRTGFGNIYVDQKTRSGPLGVGDVLAGPASAASALSVGDPAILDAASVDDLAEIADRAVRIERHLVEERGKSKARRANNLLLIHTDRAGAAQAVVEPVLEELSVRWKLAEIAPGPSGHLLLYLARLDEPAVQGAVMDRLHEAGSGAFVAAELRSLKGLKPRA